MPNQTDESPEASEINALALFTEDERKTIDERAHTMAREAGAVFVLDEGVLAMGARWWALYIRNLLRRLDLAEFAARVDAAFPDLDATTAEWAQGRHRPPPPVMTTHDPQDLHATIVAAADLALAKAERPTAEVTAEEFDNTLQRLTHLARLSRNISVDTSPWWSKNTSTGA